MSINDVDFQYIRQLVRTHTSVSLTEDKAYLVESRLKSLAQKVSLNSVSQLIQKLRIQSFNDLHLQVIESMMTTETWFFRDTYPFEAVRERILPELINKRQNQRSLNIWCAASSSGQEPYSIAILLKEHFPQLASWTISLIASDISHKMLEKARQGNYSQHEMSRGLSPDLREKYFQPQGKEWQLTTEIRQMIAFRQFNLIDSWSSMPLMDIIFLRNVLIYFDVEMKQSILAKVKQLLKPDGYLFLGGGETTINLDRAFKTVRFNKAIYYQLTMTAG